MDRQLRWGRTLRRWGTVMVTVLAGCAVLSTSSAGADSMPAVSDAGYAVPAALQPLTTNPDSPVIHDTETDAIVAQGGRLFASTDQWKYPGQPAYGQILVKDSATDPWQLFEPTQGLRVEDTMTSFPIPADQGLGPGHSILITEAVLDGRTELQWLLDGATSFTAADSYTLPSDVVDVRSFGAHESNGVWAIYAGVDPTGILQGTWSRTTHTLHFDPTPELTVAPQPSAPDAQKVTAFADCGGALYVTIHTGLYRRNDGNDGKLQHGVPRWAFLYQEPPVAPANSGLRGLTCITYQGAPALLFSTEGSGDVYRLTHLPRGRELNPPPPQPSLSHASAGMVLTPEFSPAAAIRQMLASEGTTVPATGAGSISYVIAAYNNFEKVKIDGTTRQLFGFEWAYRDECPATRTCGPVGSGGSHFDAAACFAIRDGSQPSPAYTLRCLSGPDFTLTAKPGDPILSGQAFVSIRTIAVAPFGDGRLYYGGYDCDHYPADGTAWIASSTQEALHIGG
jgi:hypothetical protein